MTQTFYITTPIYYVNDVPHLGHAYTTLVADALARFHRMRGDDTRFLTGTDEHGQKVEQTANERGMTPQQLVDAVAPRFDETWQTLGIEGYRFIRTTEERHKRVVRELWKRIRRANPDDLYLASYQGWYCIGCEAFYTESQLVKDGDTWVCAVHKKPVTWLDKERSWFFRLSRYAEPLLRHIEANPDFIRPEAYRNEIVAFLKGGLRDLSVSRTSFQWGIPVPEADPEGLNHVIYVWVDALVNYLTDLCPPDGTIGGPDVERYFPSVIHLIGKDILRFHAVYWPALLMAANLPLPRGIFAHGWWTVRGEKISKSMPATRIDPIKLSDALGEGTPLGRALGIDAMRYYLLREMPLGNDGDFTFESLFGRFNADLANDRQAVGDHAADPRRRGVQRRGEPVLAARDRCGRRLQAGCGAVRSARSVARARGDLAVRQHRQSLHRSDPAVGDGAIEGQGARAHAVVPAGEPVGDRTADRTCVAGHGGRAAPLARRWRRRDDLAGAGRGPRAVARPGDAGRDHADGAVPQA
jgi:methionyl-tRNA synthetase